MNAPRKPQRPQKPIDPLLLQRLEELGGRRRGAPLPPPKAGAKPQQQQQQQRPSAQPKVPSGLSKGASKDANARIAALAAARGPGKPSSNAPVGRRAKPARNAKLAALALSAVTTVGLAGVFANQDGGTDSIQLTNGTSADPLVTVAQAATPAPAADPATTAPAAADPATTVAAAAPATVAPAPAGIVDGTYAGQTSSNRFGNVQVQVVYSGGQISDVQILQYPNGDRRSLRISQIALPTLISESISAQSGEVNTVSGATYTSKSYKKSLQSAIDAAKAASGISG